jgi:hypothetical protein
MEVTGNTPRSTPGAVRMRAHRQRRRAGLRCLTIELFEAEIDVLIRKGLLPAVSRHDNNAVSRF